MLGFILGAQLVGWVLAFYCLDSMPDEDDSHYSTTRLIRRIPPLYKPLLLSTNIPQHS